MTSTDWREFIANGRPDESCVEVKRLHSFYSAETEERFELGQHAGPGAGRQLPVHRWVFYKEAFSPELVSEILKSAGVSVGHVLDPFAGVGTTLLEAARVGLDATGVELMPFASYAASVKVRAGQADPAAVRDVLARVLASRRRPAQIPDIPAMGWAFEEEVRERLLRYQAALDQLEPSIEKDVVRLAFLSVIEEVSQATKDGTSIRRIPAGTRRGRWGTTTSPETVRELFKARVGEFVSDLPNTVSGPFMRVFQGDARVLPSAAADRKYDMALFSPPYPNRYDYSAIYQLELGFGFVDGNHELRELRRQLLRSHMETDWPSVRTVQVPALDEFIFNTLARRRQGDQTRRMVRMVAGYFEDMRTVLEGLTNVVRPGCPVVLVVGTQMYNGYHLPTDLLLAELAQQLGFKVNKLWTLREKGISPQQRQRWGDAKTRESAMFLEV